MSESHGSVRMGPISLLVLVVMLGLAVLAVLTVTTAGAEQATSEQQAAIVTDTYRNETAAQRFVADLDDVLATAQAGGASQAAALQDAASFVQGFNEANGGFSTGKVEASIEGQSVSARFEQESGRVLSVQMEIGDNLVCEVVSWQASTVWVEPGSDNILWQG